MRRRRLSGESDLLMLSQDLQLGLGEAELSVRDQGREGGHWLGRI